VEAGGEGGGVSDNDTIPDTVADPCGCDGVCVARWLRPGLRCDRDNSHGSQVYRRLGHGDDVDLDVLALVPSVSAPDGGDCASPDAATDGETAL
jgi:hypothetical protein